MRNVYIPISILEQWRKGLENLVCVYLVEEETSFMHRALYRKEKT